MSHLYALIKWISGEDKGTYSPDIPIDWIKNFDYKQYLNSKDESPQVYAIEWRNSKKPPRGGWLFYNGLVIQVSGK